MRKRLESVAYARTITTVLFPASDLPDGYPGLLVHVPTGTECTAK